MRKAYPHTPTATLAAEFGRTDRMVYMRAQFLGLKKSAAFLASGAAGRWTGQEPGSKTHHFPKGHRPWNAGKKGWSAPGTEKTRFRKGQLPQTWLPVGTVVRNPDGYLMKKVADTRNKKRDWKGVHVLLWEERHGRIPRGKFLVFKDRNKENIRIDNLELVNRAEHMRRNTLHRLPEDVKGAIVALRTLKRRINHNGKYF